MSRTTWGVRWGVAAGAGFLLALLPLLTYGLGLGPIKVKSALNENLDAEIEFTSVNDRELKELQVGLAPVNAFKVAGIERHPRLSAIQFKVERRDNGRPYLHLTTRFPYPEPFLHILLQAEWTVGGSVGRLRREYTALIDPPFLAATKSAPIRAPRPAPTKTESEPELTLEEIAPIAKLGEPELLIEEEPAAKQSLRKEPELLIEEELEPTKAAKKEPELLLEEEPAAKKPATMEPGLLLEEESAPTKTAPTKVAKSRMVAEPVLELEPVDDSMILSDAEPTPEKFKLLGPPDHLLPGGAPAWASTGTYRVKRGDTAYGIARKIREDTSLSMEQVVLALYDSNPKAFFDNNTNNLRAGKILKIPDREVVTKRNRRTADLKFRAQYDSWQEYKLKLASARKPVTLGEPPASTKAKSAEAKAKAKPPVQEKKKIARKPAAKPEPKKKAPVTAKATRKGMEIPPSRNGRKEELLRIVRSSIDKKSQTAGKSAETESAKGKQQLTEKVETLQGASSATAKPAAGAKAGKPQVTTPSEKRLLQVENAKMAQRAKPAAKPTPQIESKPAQKPVIKKPVTKKPVQVAKKRTKPTKRISPPASKEESFTDMAMGIVDQILGNQLILIIVGGLVVLGGAIGMIYARRRKKSLSEFEESILTSGDVSTGEVSTGSEDIAGDSGDTSFLSDFSQGGMGNIATDEVDPIAEADVYLAYGRDEQAEEILKDAIIKIPSRHELKEKLLEIYAQRSDVSAFETLAEELYAALEGQGGQLWDRVAGMGSTLNPGNPMFQGGAPASSASPAAPAMDMDGGLEMTSPASEFESAAEETLAIDLGQMQDEAMSPEIEMDVGGLDMEMSGSEASDETEVVSDDALDGLEFNLDIDGDTADATPAESEPEIKFGEVGDSNALEFEPATPSADEPEEEIAFDAGELSLDVSGEEVSLSTEEEDEFAALRENTPDNNQSDLSISIGTESGEASLDASDLDMSLDVADLADDGDLGLSFGEEVDGDIAVASEVEEVGADGSADQWDEAATKLDLAKAYVDMGDSEGARSILEEVAVEGNEDQKRQAADLASQIS